MTGRRTRDLVKVIIPDKYHGRIGAARSAFNDYVSDYGMRTYSQQGEDTILRIMFHGIENGFYVDVGAHHPKRYSNTYYFYKRGWSGINVDAMPGSMQRFRKARPRDINLEMGVSKTGGTLKYFAFNESGLNGFSEENARKILAAGNGRRVVFTRDIETFPLGEILERYMPEGRTIDFLSVDVEGLDVEILESNDWDRYTPKVVLTEALDLMRMEELQQYRAYRYLREQGYVLFSKCFHTLIFVREDWSFGS